MKVYISGRISGLTKEVYQGYFEEAEKTLAEKGHETVNPASDEYASCHNLEGKTWEEIMLIDINNLSKCEAIYMLKNWRFSKGAVIEHHFARGAGKKIFFQDLNSI